MNLKKVYILEDRGIIFINGLDCKNFLQNIITNDINKVTEKSSCFASLLTPQGKFLYDFLIIKHKNGYFFDCEKTQADELIKQLSIYKLNSKVEIMNLSNEFVVASISHDRFMQFDQAKDQSGFTLKYREDPILLDPRHKKLGGRIIINLEKLYLSLKKLELKSEKPEEYYNFSFKLGIPQKNMDKLKNKIFGIECNFEELNGIDFKKGCYVGQENTARIKLKDKQSKRLLPVDLIKGDLKEGSLIYNNNKEVGKILINGEHNYALVKYRSEYFDTNLELTSENAILKIRLPEWITLN